MREASTYLVRLIVTNAVRYAGKTDIGKRRQSNQDHFLVADLGRSLRLAATSLDVDPHSLLFGSPLGHLFLVADGMGGHQAGNRASELAINYFVGSVLNSLRWIHRPDSESEKRFLAELKETLSAAHLAIVADSKTQSSFEGMGTTLTMAYVAWPKMWIVHAGDTRCYLLRNMQLQLLTRDHTLANQMASQGIYQADVSERSPWANVLWNALGAGAAEVEAEICDLALQIGDRILLCSDGLNKHVTDSEIESILNRDDPPEATCQALIDLANEGGGSDNISAIVADILQPRARDLITTVAKPPTEESIFHDLTNYSHSEGETTTDDSGTVDPNDTIDLE